jgi:hypothetical protein
MWNLIEDKIRLDISQVDSSRFNIISNNRSTLVTPRRNMYDWKNKERFLRSIIIGVDGMVISCSFPKFGNYNEFRSDTDKLDKSLVTNRMVRFTNKEDGTLCIRSVINDKVVLRTRGTIDGVAIDFEKDNISFSERFFNVAERKYCKILDPKWLPNCSMLFEYVSPDNVVVIFNKQEDLIFLGLVYHHNLRLGRWNVLEDISKDGKLNLVQSYDLPRNPLELVNEVKEWKDREGIVARCCNDQVMVKIKSIYYLAKHRVKFNINYKFLVEFIDSENICSEEDLIKKLEIQDYDWEVANSTLCLYQRYVEARNIADDKLGEAKRKLDEFMDNWEGNISTKRRDLALIACSQEKYVRHMMFALYDGKDDCINTIRKNIIITKGREQNNELV